ncbi:MAG: lysophospholipid acyltransferase family protein [Polyangiaceae bacterium]|nr:lysophospholipid acyltransferase family protein [Polyangiaceae bacterium]
MRPLKKLAQALFLAVWCSTWITLALIAALVTWNRNVPLWMARKLWAYPLIWATGARYRAEPLPDVDFSTPHIFVMNHQSMLDIACAFYSIPTHLRFMAKEVLKYIPFLGWYMWATGMIFIDRSKGTKALRSLTKAAERIRNGANILVFPEGTRSKTGAILPFKRGPFVLALQAGVPIIPVAIEGSGRVLPSGGFDIVPGEVRLKLGTPILTAGRSKNQSEALMHEVHAALVELHRSIGGKTNTDLSAAPQEGTALAEATG